MRAFRWLIVNDRYVVDLRDRLAIAVGTEDVDDLQEQTVVLNALNGIEMTEALLRSSGIGSLVTKDITGPLKGLGKALVKKWKAGLLVSGGTAAAARARVRRASNPRPMSNKDKQVAVERCASKLRDAVTPPETVAKVLAILDGLSLSDTLLETSGVESVVLGLGKQHHSAAMSLVVKWGCQRALSRYNK